MNDRLSFLALNGADAGGAPPCANGARILLETLIAHGVDTIFGYPGGALLPLYDALYAEPRLRHVAGAARAGRRARGRRLCAHAPGAPAWWW